MKRIFKRIAPAVVWLTLLDGTTIGVAPEHEVYTEAQGWRYVSELETSSSLVDASGAPLTIVAIDIDPTPRAVYNLETSCGTYFAQGVWAHNCRIIRSGIWRNSASQSAARRAAFREAGWGRHGGIGVETVSDGSRIGWLDRRRNTVVWDDTAGHHFPSNDTFEPGHFQMERFNKADKTAGPATPVKFGWDE